MKMASSPFEPLYRRPGAVAVAVAGFEAEYRAACESALALDRTHRGRIRVSGRDRETFLHNMLSNDVRTLSPWAGIPAVFLTSKGKLVTDLLLFKLEDSMVAELERERVEPFRRALDRYVVSEDVALEDLAGKAASFSLEGPEASSILGGLLRRPRAELDGLPHLHVTRGEIFGAPLTVTAQRRELTPRYDVSAPFERAAGILEGVLEGGARLGGELVAEARRVEAGRPRFGIDMDESHFPLEAGLDEAINFQKGCYIGQEYVVRLAHRGHLNRKLVGIRVAGMTPPAAGSPVWWQGNEVGAVTSSAPSPAFGCALALAYVKREAFEPGTRVTVSGGVEAEVSPLPFPRERSSLQAFQ
jgi:folate-binding protein YgfZ